MIIEFPGTTSSLTDEALVLRSHMRLNTLSSAIVGGGFGCTRWIINRHVHKDYDSREPATDLRAFAGQQGIEEPFIGLMTAANLNGTHAATVAEQGIRVTAIVSAGIGNAASPGLSPPAPFVPGTINTILLVQGDLTPSAMVNAVITATETKSLVLVEHNLRTIEGYPATGTSTDAVVIACTGQGISLPYAGPATHVGWLIGQSVRRALEEALP